MTNTKYFILLLILFFALGFWGILHHEIWSDEANAWLLARDSNSLKELLYQVRYEGHPCLWNVLLYGISKYTHDPFWMQFLHISISSASVVLFLFYSPFTRLEKTLYLVGYFIFYEYNTISRNYALTLLLLNWAILLISNKQQHYVLLSIVLFLLANTHLFGMIIAFWLAGYVAYLDNSPSNNSKIIWMYCVLFTGMGLCAYQLVPSLNSPFAPYGKNYIHKIPVVLSLAFKGLVPFPDFSQASFWNTNLFFSYLKIPSYLLSPFLLFIPFLFLIKKPITLLFYYFSIVGILTIVCITSLGSVRHFGFFYILLIASSWLSTYEPERNWYKKFKITNILGSIHTKINRPLFLALLVIQAICGISMYLYDMRKTFDDGKNVAIYLQKNAPDNCVLLTYDIPIPTISAYMGKKIYCLSRERFESFLIFNRNENYRVNHYEDEVLLLKRAINFTRKEQKNVFLIGYPTPIKTKSEIRKKFEQLKVFHSGITNSAPIYLYKVYK